MNIISSFDGKSKRRRQRVLVLNVEGIENEKRTPNGVLSLAEKERFELSRRVNPTYTLSRGASSAS